jgi:cobalt/nickel transport system permease protein
MLDFLLNAHIQTPSKRNILDHFDARVRILVFVILASMAALSSQILTLCFILFLALTFACLAKLSVITTLKKVLAMDAFIFMLVLMLPFTTTADSPETVIFTLFDLPASQQGLNKAISILLIANSVILLVLSLVGTQDTHTLGVALLRLKVPSKLIHLMFFSLRYTDVIHKEYKRMRQAMKVRGFTLKTNWHTWRSVGYLIGMLLIRSLERSHRIHNAMLCRGFDSESSARLLVDQDTLHWQAKDTVFLMGAVIVAGLLFLYELIL